MTSVEFPQEVMQTIVTKAILDGLGEHTRDLLLQQAVTALVTPTKENYGKSSTNTTPIQQAFINAAHLTMQQIAREVVAEDEGFREQIRAMIRDAIQQALDVQGDYAPLRDGMVHAVAQVLLNARVGT